MADLYHFAGLIFADTHTRAHCILYNHIFFTGKYAKIGPLEIFPLYSMYMYTYYSYIHVGQRLRVRSRSGSHSEPGTGISLAAKKREWTETSEASQEDERETGGEGEGLHPEAKRLVQGAQPTSHHMK